MGVNIGICLDNNQGNFQLHRFTRREYRKKFWGGLHFLTHTVDMPLSQSSTAMYWSTCSETRQLIR